MNTTSSLHSHDTVTHFSRPNAWLLLAIIPQKTKNTYICHTYKTEVEELCWGVYLTSSLLHLFVPYITILIRSTFCCSFFLVAQFMVGCLLWMWRNFCHLFFYISYDLIFHFTWFHSMDEFILFFFLFLWFLFIIFMFYVVLNLIF